MEKISKLNSRQIDFLKGYPHPFTIVTEMKTDFIFPSFLDRNLYKDFGLRVAESFLTEEGSEMLEFPIFLTSANNSGEEEIYDYSELQERFGKYGITMID